MSIPMSLLAILEEEPEIGVRIKEEFERRTSWVWPLNAGQVYSTLARLERQGLIDGSVRDTSARQRSYQLTSEGMTAVATWFESPVETASPSRDELVLKMLMVLPQGREAALAVIQIERRATLELLQQYTHLKLGASPEEDVGWLMLLDSLIFQGEARARWLDACEQRIQALDHSEAREPKSKTPRRSHDRELIGGGR